MKRLNPRLRRRSPVARTASPRNMAATVLAAVASLGIGALTLPAHVAAASADGRDHVGVRVHATTERLRHHPSNSNRADQVPGEIHSFSEPDIVANADGRLEAFVANDEGKVKHAWQTTPGGPWSSWESLGGDVSDGPSVMRNADGRLEVFALDEDFSVEHAWQITPGGNWSAWSNLGNGGRRLLNVTATANADGRLEVFALTNSGHLLHSYQTTANDGWTGWYDLGGDFVTRPAAAVDSAGHMEVFLVDAAHHMEHASQEPGTASGWGPWSTFGTQQFVSDPAVARNADGRLEAFAVGTDGTLDHIFQLAPGGSWSGWYSLGAPAAGPPIGTPDIGANADGRLEAFVVAPDGAVHHIWQVRPNSGWSTWQSLGGLFVSPLSVALNQDGNLELLAISPAGEPFHNAQAQTNSGWGTWNVLT